MSQSRLDMARETAEDLLNELETQDIPIEKSLMKAKRLARLMRDVDAQKWIDFEIRGYPKDFNFNELGTCYKYAESGGRINPVEGKYWPQSLPGIEAQKVAEGQALSSISIPMDFSPNVDNYVASGATLEVINSYRAHLAAQKESYKQSSQLLASLKSCIHAYAMETYLALQLGDVAEDLFQSARVLVDRFARAYALGAAEKLVAINERLLEGDLESRAAALNSCRRLLLYIADSIYPAQDTPYVDSNGNPHNVGKDDYKNRLMAYLDQYGLGGKEKEIIKSEIEHLASRLDSVYELSCKGIHAGVSIDEARLAVIHTYLFVAEIARAAFNLDKTEYGGQESDGLM